MLLRKNFLFRFILKQQTTFRRPLSSVVASIENTNVTPEAVIPQAKEKKDALGMSVTDFEEVLGEEFQKFRGAQINSYVHHKKIKEWSEAKGLPVQLRYWLDERLSLVHGNIIERKQSSDGTRKYLMEVSPGKIVECVLIPETDRSTLCVSSQVGCSLQCKFCHTGTQKFESNLTSGEILRQYISLPEDIRESITNIVFMGQGEPLYNYRNVSKAVSILTDASGIGFGRGRIVISTSGIAPLVPKVASEMAVNLAISLHAPNDELRSAIMPINKTYPLAILMQACQDYINESACATRRISFEYVMLRGVNDQESHARELFALIKHLPCHVNLIPFNPWPGSQYRTSYPDDISRFAKILEELRMPVTIRRTRGKDILAACGQLKSSTLSKSTITD